MKQVTLKKVSTNEPNISERNITYDLYVEGEYVATYRNIHDALEAQEQVTNRLEKKMNPENNNPSLTPAQVLEIANAAGMELDTLETRKMDDLDFYEVAVWNIEKAIKAAYEAGQKSTTSQN